MLRFGGRALIDLGANKLTKLSQTPNAKVYKYSSEPMGDKLHRREGNNPDHQLRPLNVC